jgi:hypothetical protein
MKNPEVNMNNRSHTSESKYSERGQAVVLLVLAMVVLLGFTALAVDGSMVYADRRFSQDGSDASSLAGGAAAAEKLESDGVINTTWSTNASCTIGNVAPAASIAQIEAVNGAQRNSFTVDQLGVSTTCGTDTITSPAKDEHGHDQTSIVYTSNYMDVTTHITSTTRTSFAHFVFAGIMQNTVTAVTRVRPRQPLAFGKSIVALNPDTNCNTTNTGANFHGIGGGVNNITINGGGVWSNGCFTMSGTPNALVNNGGVTFFATDNSGTGYDINIQNPPADPLRLTDTNARIPPSAYDVDFDPSTRCTGRWVDGDDLLNVGPIPAGLYCINDNLNMQASDVLTGTGVTLYFPNGYFNVNGGAKVQLIAPDAYYLGPAIPGVVIYVPPTNPVNNKDVQINGNSESFYQGTILAPSKTIDFNGDGNITTVNAQIIGWNVKVGGSSTTSVNYDANTLASRPTYIDLYR